MTEYAFNHGQKIKSIGPEMPEDPACFPKASNMLRVEQGSVRCATCKFLTEETRRRAQYLQDLFIQDQASVGPHLDFIRSPTPPQPPFICKSSAKKTRFPNIAPH